MKPTPALALPTLVLSTLLAAGCQPTFRHHRSEGLRLLDQQRYGAARGHLLAAHELVPEHAATLCDLAECHLGLAQTYLDRRDRLPAMREVDQALNYYSRAIRSFPGYSRALRGKNTALELRGLSDDALATAYWASTTVGPSVEQQLFLARELAERGDADSALLAYRQAVAMEPQSPTAHWALGLYYIDLQRRDEAITHLQEAQRLDPRQDAITQTLRELGVELAVEPAPHSG